MGKSSSLRRDFEELITTWTANNDTGVLIDLGAVTSVTDLQTELSANSVVRTWIAGSEVLHLCLDSLDEALPQYPGLPKALMQVIKDFPPERMRLAMTCRAGEFPPYLQNELISHFGNDRVGTWHMAPLRRKDVHMAATENGLDGDQFLTAVSEREVKPLAARPITLELH